MPIWRDLRHVAARGRTFRSQTPLPSSLVEKRCLLTLATEFEDPDGAVPPVGGKDSAVWTDRDRPGQPLDADECLQLGGVFVAPELDAVIGSVG
jgi:hypothetical protein